jgi:lipoyl(octanoyl) transferase
VDLDFRTVGLGPDAVDYLAGWELQREVHNAVATGARAPTVLLLEHPPVFTAGKRTQSHERPADPGGAEVIDVDRGGKITFHGPGQLVGYPIVRLPDHVFVVDYVRRIEEALIAVCRDFGLAAGRVAGRSGVWMAADPEDPITHPERKLAALGIRVSRGVTMHGFALNCNVDLRWYDRFVPCGIADAGVTSLSAELGRDVTPAETLPAVRKHLRTYLSWGPYERSPNLQPTADATRTPEPAARISLLTPHY